MNKLDNSVNKKGEYNHCGTTQNIINRITLQIFVELGECKKIPISGNRVRACTLLLELNQLNLGTERARLARQRQGRSRVGIPEY